MTSGPEQEITRKANVELANAYRDMMAMFAWKHLKGNIIERIKLDVNRDIDSMPINELTVAHVAEARGIRKAFEKIDDELNWILNGYNPITRK